MRFIKDVGSVHEKVTFAEESLIRHELTVKLSPVPHYSDKQAVQWGWSARVWRNEGSDIWGYAEGYDPERVILDAVADYEKRRAEEKS